MRCDVVGRDHSPQLVFPFVSIPCCRTARSVIRSRGPRSTLLRALALALAEQPNAAARLIGGRAIRSESIDIGVAVEAQDGIMVPVIRNADKTSLADLTSRYTELVELARRRRLTADMTSGGIASISNFGTFGLDWGTPIPLPIKRSCSASALAKKMPTWSEEKQQFVPTTQAELTLELRSPQPRWRRRGTLAEARDRVAWRPGEL